MRPVSVTVITPSVGRATLTRAMNSVKACASEDLIVEHLVVVDGPCFEKESRAMAAMLDSAAHYTVKLMTMPFKTGRSGAMCRATAAAIARGDFVAFLDDDNWYLPHHLKDCVDVMTAHPKLHWMHTGRYVVSPDYDETRPVKRIDQCQSLGLLHRDWGMPLHHMVDTNCFFLKRNTAHNSASHWYLNPMFENWGEDRLFYAWLVCNFPDHGFLFKPSVGYVAHEGVCRYIDQGNRKIGSKTSRHLGSLHLFSRNYSFPIKHYLLRSYWTHRLRKSGQLA